GDVDKSRGATIDQMAEKAIEIGLESLAVTDHLEIQQLLGTIFPPLDNDGIKRDIFAAKEKYKGKLNLIYGVELAQMMHDIKKTQALLEIYPFEYIIGSVHAIRGYHDFSEYPYDEASDETLLKMWDIYLSEMKEMLSWGCFDVLAHITYPYRYYKYFHREQLLKIEKNGKEYFEDIFKTIIQKGIALEINTSGLRQGLGCTLPNSDLAKFYYELGGRLISVGSDAHYTCDIGKNISDAYEMCRQIGFKTVTVFVDGESKQKNI
ncbi:MAG: histidinol-phosphatase HisJ family protein, partial [Clostridia bacterium]